jgi:hypothetical protein
MASTRHVKLHVQNKGNAEADIKFSIGQPFQLEPVLPTLHQLSEIVSGCIDALEKAYLTSA